MNIEQTSTPADSGSDERLNQVRAAFRQKYGNLRSLDFSEPTPTYEAGYSVKGSEGDIENDINQLLISNTERARVTQSMYKEADLNQTEYSHEQILSGILSNYLNGEFEKSKARMP